MAEQFLLGPAHVVYLFVFLFLFTLIFLFASCGHSVALFALLHTFNPLTSADNVNCLPLPPPSAGDTCCMSSNTFTVFLSPPSSHCARGGCVFLFIYLFNVTVLTGCAWKPRCVTLLTTVSVNASPAQSALFPPPHPHLLSCLPVRQSQHTLVDWPPPPAVALHLISSSTTGLDFSALF